MKKMLRVLSAVMVFMLLICSVALAEPKADKKAEKAWEKQVKELEKVVKEANKEIKAAVKAAQKTPYDDVDELLAKVDAIAAGVKAQGAAMGIEVACDYEYYVVDGQTVAIDPLRVINPSKTIKK